MRRVRLGIIGAGAVTEWAILPVLSGPDAVTPPDTGAWWSRRPSAHSTIRYQAPALPEVVAIADADGERAERVGQAARVRAIYSDWRRMLREVQLDAIICATTPETAGEVALASPAGVQWLWAYGPPTVSVAATFRLAQRLTGRATRLWCARPLRAAAAHRAARQLLERDEIGAVAALTLRWGTSFYASPKRTDAGVLTPDEASHLASSYAAIDLLLGLGSSTVGGFAVPVRVLASETNGATLLTWRYASGAGVTALFAGAESWNAPLPRLEICGTEGRSIICEAGRRLWLYKPHEATRFMEPPGLSTHISAAGATGLAEDLKAFLNACVESLEGRDPQREPDAGGATADMLMGAARVLQLLEAAGESLRVDGMVEIEPLQEVQRKAAASDTASDQAGGTQSKSEATSFTLPLQL